MSQEIELITALEALRRQLARVVEGGDGQTIRFEIPKIELELKVGVRAAESAGGELSFKLFGIGLGAKGGSEVGDEQVQTLRLELKPIRMEADGKTRRGRQEFGGTLPGAQRG